MKRTERGFAIYAEFKDEYGKNIRVQRSSLATKRCVWIQNEVTEHMGVHLANAHLTISMARRVVKALQAFIDGKEHLKELDAQICPECDGDGCNNCEPIQGTPPQEGASPKQLICRNPNHFHVDGSPSEHEIGPSCMAEGASLSAALRKSVGAEVSQKTEAAETAESREHDCDFPFDGYLRDGQRWTCVVCGREYEWFEDEAEGGFWELLEKIQDSGKGLSR